MSDNTTYKDAGVDIDKADRITADISELVRDTFSPRVMEEGPGFAGLFALDYKQEIFSRDYKDPVLLGATDGVGTKLKVAFRANKHDTIGIDLVAMVVNDLMVQGGEPLFFLDYLSSGALDEHVMNEVVEGIVEGCKQAGCALLGGETAEMPGFYNQGEYDMAGFCVGVAERSRLVTGKKITPGDVVLGFPSSGLHSNGYSLARLVLLQEGELTLDDVPDGLDRTLEEEMLEPTKIYAPVIRHLFNYYRSIMPIKGMAHITGGGLIDNIERVLPSSCDVELDAATWSRPPIFDLIRTMGDVELAEMYRTFNMGIGLAMICDPHFKDAIPAHVSKHAPGATVIGKVVEGGGMVRINGVDGLH